MQAKWVRLTTAPDQIIGEMWVELLRGEGIDAKLSPGDQFSYLGVSTRPVRVLVPADQEAVAREMLARLGLPAE